MRAGSGANDLLRWDSHRHSLGDLGREVVAARRIWIVIAQNGQVTGALCAWYVSKEFNHSLACRVRYRGSIDRSHVYTLDGSGPQIGIS